MLTLDLDTTDVSGYAIVVDGGPFTAIQSLEYLIQTEPCDDGTRLHPSPAPPACAPLAFYGEASDWTMDGRMYDFGGDVVSILRRGSVETGDPSLLLMDAAGNVLIFRETE